MQRWRRMLTFMVCDTATNSKDQKTGGVRSEFLEATPFSLTWFTELSWMDAIPRSRGILFVSVILLDLTIIFQGLNFHSENYYYYWGCTLKSQEITFTLIRSGVDCTLSDEDFSYTWTLWGLLPLFHTVICMYSSCTIHYYHIKQSISEYYHHFTM